MNSLKMGVFPMVLICFGVGVDPPITTEAKCEILQFYLQSEEKDEPLTIEEQCALGSEMGELMRIARIPRPGAMYGAPFPAQTLGGADGAILNPFDFD